MVLCFLDINPLSSGHTLIIPKKHFKDISDIDSKYLSSINDATKYVYNLLMSKLGPDGIRIVQNNGICQEIKHYHVHLIPVYKEGTFEYPYVSSDNLDEILDKLTK